MRAPLIAVTCALALAAACGGQTAGVGGGGHGSSSSGGGSSGGSSSGGGSSSSGGASSSGGSGCVPLPGCSSSTECPEPNGCGECYCQGSGWECTGCGDDAVDASIPDSSIQCPPVAPADGSLCPENGLACGYASDPGGCGESCDCLNGTWACSYPPCPPPVCPPDPPTPQTSCIGSGLDCYYPDDAGCGGEACSCDSTGLWECSVGDCIDAGPPDAGLCPGSMPANGDPCDMAGDVCSYLSLCTTNCLCTATGWVCATQGC